MYLRMSLLNKLKGENTQTHTQKETKEQHQQTIYQITDQRSDSSSWYMHTTLFLRKIWKQKKLNETNR